jgi:hypothetical protein
MFMKQQLKLHQDLSYLLFLFNPVKAVPALILAEELVVEAVVVLTVALAFMDQEFVELVVIELHS